MDAPFLFGIERVAPHCIVFFEDNVKLLKIAQLSPFIVGVGIGPGFVAVFQSSFIGLAETRENLTLRSGASGNLSHWRTGEVVAQGGTS